MDIADLRARFQREASPALTAEIRDAVQARISHRGGHLDWGLLCEEAGLLPLGFREFQLALRDDPDDAAAALRLAHHLRERGDSTRAQALREHLLERDPAREEWLSPFVDLLLEDGLDGRARAAAARAVGAIPPARANLLLRRTTPAQSAEAPSDPDCVRFLTLFSAREEVEREHAELRKAFVALLRRRPDRTVVCKGGKYVLGEKEGVEELGFEPEAPALRSGPQAAKEGPCTPSP